jgi:hypothetical protein
VKENEMNRSSSTNEREQICTITYWLEAKRKRPLGRPRCRWVNNIKMDLRWDGIMWTGLIWLKIGTSGGHLFPVRDELGFIPQKTTFFIVTALKTPNLTFH